MICDEPTSALDVTIQDQILDLLENLKKKLSITIIIISHDISVVKYLSKRILVIKDGKIVKVDLQKKCWKILNRLILKNFCLQFFAYSHQKEIL